MSDVKGHPNAPMRVFCPRHDEYRAMYTCGRPELNDVCPQCEVASLRAERNTANAVIDSLRNEVAGLRAESTLAYCVRELTDDDVWCWPHKMAAAVTECLRVMRAALASTPSTGEG